MNIYDRATLTERLNKLTENSIANWGVMRPQNMVENYMSRHLHAVSGYIWVERYRTFR